MTDISQLKLTRQDLDQLQRLRAEVLAFQNSVAPLPATQSNNDYNEYFNQLRLEAKSILNPIGFDKRVSQAVTLTMLKERQTVLLPNLSGVVILGAILTMLGLGGNSVVPDDVLINSLGCCISSGGMLLIVGTLAVWSVVNFRLPLSNFGEVYQHCEALLLQINHALNMAIPGLSNQPALPQRSVIDLALDSLNKQALDWRQKLTGLEQQRLMVEPNIPLALTLNLDFVQRELARVEQEIEHLQGKLQRPESTPTDGGAGVHQIPLPGGRKIAVKPVTDVPPPPPSLEKHDPMFETAEATTIPMNKSEINQTETL